MPFLPLTGNVISIPINTVKLGDGKHGAVLPT